MSTHLYTCKCLNVSIRVIDEIKVNLEEEPEKSIIQQKLSDSVKCGSSFAGVQAVIDALCEKENVAGKNTTFVSAKCRNCNTTCTLYSSTTRLYFLNSVLLDEEAASCATKDAAYSKIFGIISYPQEGDSQLVTMDNNEILQSLQKKMQRELTRLKAETEERIKSYAEKERREFLAMFQQTHQQRNAIFDKIVGVQKEAESKVEQEKPAVPVKIVTTPGSLVDASQLISEAPKKEVNVNDFMDDAVFGSNRNITTSTTSEEVNTTTEPPAEQRSAAELKNNEDALSVASTEAPEADIDIAGAKYVEDEEDLKFKKPISLLKKAALKKQSSKSEISRHQPTLSIQDDISMEELFNDLELDLAEDGIDDDYESSEDEKPTPIREEVKPPVLVAPVIAPATSPPKPIVHAAQNTSSPRASPARRRVEQRTPLKRNDSSSNVQMPPPQPQKPVYSASVPIGIPLQARMNNRAGQQQQLQQMAAAAQQNQTQAIAQEKPLLPEQIASASFIAEMNLIQQMQKLKPQEKELQARYIFQPQQFSYIQSYMQQKKVQPTKPEPEEEEEDEDGGPEFEGLTIL